MNIQGEHGRIMKHLILSSMIVFILGIGSSVVADEMTGISEVSVVSNTQVERESTDHTEISQEAVSSSPADEVTAITSTDAISTTQTMYQSNVILKGMTWQKSVGTGALVDFGVAYESDGEVTFKWEYFDISQGSWQTFSESPSNWATFQAPHTGQYLIHVSATNSDGSVSTLTIGWQVEEEAVTLKGMTWQLLEEDGSRANIGVAYTANSQVTFTWQYYDISRNEWHSLSRESGSSWVTFNASHTGQYLIHVEAKTEGGQVATYTIGWQVLDVFVNLKGMTWQKLDKYGATANIGLAYQSNSQVTFTWQYYDISRNEWHQIARDTPSNWVTFNAPHTGSYLIYVEAKLSNGQTSNYSIGWQVSSKSERIYQVISKASSYGGQMGGWPFIAWYGSNPVGWCTIFVSYIFNEVGLSDLVPMTHLPQVYYQYFQSIGQLYQVPQIGDIAIFNWPNNPWPYGPGHTAIVDDIAADGTVRTISGNTGNYVSYYYTNYKDMSKAYGLVGFGRPNY